jgi:poly(A) polymerase
MMQPRFERRSGNGPYTLVEQPRYRAGYDFLKLRGDAGEIGTELAEWWEDFALGGDDDREAMLAAAREAHPRGPRRVPGPKPVESSPPAADPDTEDGDTGEVGLPARKRRRRRRKPAAAGSGAGTPSSGDT